MKETKAPRQDEPRLDEEELATLREQCFASRSGTELLDDVTSLVSRGDASAEDADGKSSSSSSSSSLACRGLGNLLARYRRHAQAREAWKRGCKTDGDAGSCWRVALLHHRPSGSWKTSSSSSSSSSSTGSQNEVPAESAAEVPFPNEKKAAKYAMLGCPEATTAEGEACVAAGRLTGDQQWWKHGCSKAKYLPACALYTKDRTSRFVSACEKGDDAPSCYNLGVLSMSGMMEGEKNPTRASEYFKRACAKGHGSSCYNLAQLYRKHMIGSGRENAREAAGYFSQACEAGHLEGCFNLGYLFQYGIGCPRDEMLALKVYKKACDADKPVLDACFNLGVLTKEASYFKRACDAGMREACRYATSPQATDQSNETEPSSAVEKSSREEKKH